MKRISTPHWIRRTHLFDPDEYECSQCGQHFPRAAERCPKCGASLRGIEDNQDWVDEAEEQDWILGDD